MHSLYGFPIYPIYSKKKLYLPLRKVYRITLLDLLSRFHMKTMQLKYTSKAEVINN